MKPVRPHMFSSAEALRLALRDQPRLLEGRTQISVKGELYSVDHDQKHITPTPLEEYRTVFAEDTSYAGHLRAFFNVGNPEMAARIQHIVFFSSALTDPVDTATVSLRPQNRAHSVSTTDSSIIVSELENYWSRTGILQPDAPAQERITTATIPIGLPSGLAAKIEAPLTSNDVLFGLNAVDSYDNQGIPRSYLEKTQAVANQIDMIIAIRPVERICRTLIEEGVSSKGLNIKGKSSNWGPMAGYIPYNQEYSKLAAITDINLRQQQIHVANAMNKKAVTLQGVEIDNLVLSPARWQELVDLGQIKNITKADAAQSSQGLCIVRFQANPKGQPEQNFQGRQQADGRWLIYTDSGDPLQVIPKTSDFDLFFSFTHFENIEMTTLDKMRPFDPRLGIYSDRDQTLIKALNKAYNRGVGKDMVHHGSDVSNPATDMEANLPATVFIPNSMLPMGVYTDSPLMIKTMPELIRLFRTMRDGGIRIESNELWADLQAIVKEPFQKTARVLFERRKSTS